MDHQGTRDVFEYIGGCISQSPDGLACLYQDAFVVKAVFRILPPIIQQLTLRMLIPMCSLSDLFALNSGDPEQRDQKCLAMMEDIWREHKGAMEEALLFKAFERCEVLSENPEPKEKIDVQLCGLFANTLKAALSSNCAVPFQRKVDTRGIELEAWEKVDGILGHILGAQNSTSLPEETEEMVFQAGLVKTAEGEPSPGAGEVELSLGGGRGRKRKRAQIATTGEGPVLTSKGFHFLLQDVYSQLWMLVSEHMSSLPQSHQYDIVKLICSLPYCTPSGVMPLRELSGPQQDAVSLFQGLGMTHICGDRSGWCPTQFGLHMASRAANRPMLQHSTNEEDVSAGTIIVETNNRVYAYINSPLQVSLLKHFVEIRFVVSHLAVGVITRQSITGALKKGITGEQILNYLYQRAHPEMKKKEQVLPGTVVDQIRLWERERNRLGFQDAVLHKCTPEDFEEMKAWAAGKGILLMAKPPIGITGHGMVITKARGGGLPPG